MIEAGVFALLHDETVASYVEIYVYTDSLATEHSRLLDRLYKRFNQ